MSEQLVADEHGRSAAYKLRAAIVTFNFFNESCLNGVGAQQLQPGGP